MAENRFLSRGQGSLPALSALVGVATLALCWADNCLSASDGPPNVPVVEATPEGPMSEGKPTTLTLRPGPALMEKIKEAASGARKAPTIRLTVEGLTITGGSEVGLRLFLNKPDSDAKSLIDDPHYVGSFTLLRGPTLPDKPQTVFLDATHTLRKIGARAFAGEADLKVTLVPVPLRANDKIEQITITFSKVRLSAHD